MAGEALEFSAADLAATAAAFDPKVGKAPIVVGHPATDDPAMGWAARLVANERGLFAQATQVLPQFAQAVNDGRYGTVSVKFYRPDDPANPKPGVWYLRHIGFLGANAPAVTGLDDPAFAAAAAAAAAQDAGVCFAHGVQLAPGDATCFATTPPEESTVTEEEAERLRAQNAAQAAEIAALQASQRAAQRAAVHAAHVAFCAPLPGVPADWRPRVVALADHLAEQGHEVAFGEGDQAVPLLDVFKQFLTALPAPVNTGEEATRERAAGGTGGTSGAAGAGGGAAFAAPAGYRVDAGQLALHEKVLAYAREHKVPYHDAALLVQ